MHKRFMYIFSRLYHEAGHYASRHARIVSTLKIAIVFGLFYVHTWQRLDPDFGWHLTAGNYIRQHWIPSHDLFTYTAKSYPWINHEWASDVIVSWLYQIGGFIALTVVFAGLWTAAICLFRNKIKLGVLIVATLALLPYVSVRPMVWSLVFLALLIETINRKFKHKILYLPVLFILWANLHGGFIVGLAVIAYFIVKKRQWLWVWLLLICTLVTFINPYGPRLYLEILHTLSDPALHHEITEWLYFHLPRITWFFIILWGVGFVLYDKNKLKNWFGLGPIFLIASLSASRNFPLFVVIGLRDIDKHSQLFRLPKDLDKFRKAIIALFILATIGIIGYFMYISYLPLHNREAGYPKQAIAYLQTHKCSGHLFNFYDYGGYVIWKLPSVPVYIDGRMPSWRDPEGKTYMKRYNDILDKSSVRKEEFTRYNIRCALLSSSSIHRRLNNSLRADGWSVASKGNGAVLLMAPNK